MILQLKYLGTVNKNKVTMQTAKGSLDVYFSYETPVCFVLHKNGLSTQQTHENSWGVTTGKFLNELEPNKKARIGAKAFEALLQEAMENIDL